MINLRFFHSLYTIFFLGCGRCRTVKTTFVQGHKRSINADKSKHTDQQQDAQTRRPAIPSQICVSSGKTANQTHKRGKSPNNKTHKKICQGTQRTLPLCHTQKHAKINYSPRHAAKHRNRSTARSFVVIDENCTRAYKHRLSQRPLRCTCA